MKIRQGFVSNSSSAAFIIGIKAGHICPTCGRSDVDFLKKVEEMGPGMESKITHVSGEMIIKEAEEYISAEKERLAELGNRPDDELINPDWKDWTVGRSRKENNERIAEYEQKICKVKEAMNNGLLVAEIELSNHFDVLPDLLRHLINKGQITLVAYEDHT